MNHSNLQNRKLATCVYNITFHYFSRCKYFCVTQAATASHITNNMFPLQSILEIYFAVILIFLTTYFYLPIESLGHMRPCTETTIVKQSSEFVKNIFNIIILDTFLQVNIGHTSGQNSAIDSTAAANYFFFKYRNRMMNCFFLIYCAFYFYILLLFGIYLR